MEPEREVSKTWTRWGKMSIIQLAGWHGVSVSYMVNKL
jgi:hypothetical protein